MTQDLSAQRMKQWNFRISLQARLSFFCVLFFGLFSHGMGLLNKLSHQDDIANLFSFGATITSGRWMLHVLSWLEALLFGTGNASLPFYNGLISVFCVGAVCILLVDLLKIRNKVFCALLGCFLIAFPVLTALFSYMFTSHPYMIGLLMMMIGAYLICRETVWWMKGAAVILVGASIGVYQAWLSVLLAVLLIYDIIELSEKERIHIFFQRIGIQVICVVGGVLAYFAANRFFLNKFGVELTSYQGIDRMGIMSLSTFLERCGNAYRFFFCPVRNVSDDMYPGTLYYMYYIMLIMNGSLAVHRIKRTGKESRIKAIFLMVLFSLIPLGCNFIYVMSEDAHGLMVYGQAMQAVLLLVQLDEMESYSFKGRQTISIIASLMLAVICMMYARFDNQCYLKDTLQQQAAMSYYTTLITQIKSQKGYRPDMEVCFVNDWSELDPTIYNLDEMDFIHLNLYGHNTTEYIHIAKEFFMRKWCGFEARWYWGESPENWPEVQKMPEYPADGSIRIINDVLIVKF